MRADVDYLATARREPWSAVPAAVVHALETACGSPIVSAGTPVQSGFGGQYAGPVRLGDGRYVFVKAASRTTLAFQAECLARETQLLATFPSTVPCTQTIAHSSVAGWEAVALAVVDGTHPGLPWTARTLDLTYDACAAIASSSRSQDGVLPAWLESLDLDQFGATITGDRRTDTAIDSLSVGDFRLPEAHKGDVDLARWLTSYGEELAGLARTAADLEGTSLVHNDLRPDNILIVGSAHDAHAVFLDWNWVCLGPAWIDFVGLLPMAHRQGLDTAEYLSRPLLRDAEPDALDAFVAFVACYMLGALDSPLPPGVTEHMHSHRALFAHDFVAYLAHRRDWN